MPKNNVVVLITGKDDTQTAFQSVQQNLTKMGEKAQETQEHIHGLGLSFSKFFEAELAIHAVIGALSRLKEMAEQVGEISERLNIMHEATGISTQSLGAFAAEGHMAGVSLEQLQRSVSHMEQSFEEARQGLTQDKRAYAELGVSVDELSKKHATMDEVLMKVADGFQKTTDPAKRAYAAIEIFGRAGSLLLPFLEDGSAGIKKMSDRLKEMGVDTSEQAVANLAQLDRQLRMLEIEVLALAATFTQHLQPALEEVAGAMGGAQHSAGDLAGALGTGIGGVLRALTAAFIAFDVTVKNSEDYLLGFGATIKDIGRSADFIAHGDFFRAGQEMAARSADFKTYTDAIAKNSADARKAIENLWATPGKTNAPTKPGEGLGLEGDLAKGGRSGAFGAGLPDAGDGGHTGLEGENEKYDKMRAQIKKYADQYDAEIYRMQETYRSFSGFTRDEDRRDFEQKMDLMNQYYDAAKHHVDPALDPIAKVASPETLENIHKISDAMTTAASATDSFAKAWERAGTQIAKIIADSAIAKWGPDGTDPGGLFKRHKHSTGGDIGSAVGALAGGTPAGMPAGMPVPGAAGSSKGVKGFFKSYGSALGIGGKSGGGSGGVTVNLYNQGSPATVSKTSSSSGSGSSSSGNGLDKLLHDKVVDVFLKDAGKNGPMWQAITGAVSSGG